MAEAGWSRDELQARFRRFGTVECPADSPLYACLALAVADSELLLELAAACAPGQPPPNLLLSAIHELLLMGIDHPLGRAFPTVDRTASGASLPLSAGVLEDFCTTHRDALRHRLQTRRVQTNEIGRVALFLPALLAIASRTLEPLATVELGASAGLNLLWPWVAVDYGAHGRMSPARPGLHLSCQVRSGRPPRSSEPPPHGLRLGLDSHPVDPADHQALRWLVALTWPEHHDRRSRLLAAARLARQRGAQVRQGDLRQDLHLLLEAVPPGQQLVVLHSMVLYQLDQADRERLDEQLAALGQQRRIYRVGIEWIGTPTSELSLTRYEGGERRHAVLARVHPHGRWLEWLDTAVP